MFYNQSRVIIHNNCFSDIISFSCDKEFRDRSCFWWHYISPKILGFCVRLARLALSKKKWSWYILLIWSEYNQLLRLEPLLPNSDKVGSWTVLISVNHRLFHLIYFQFCKLPWFRSGVTTLDFLDGF